MSETAEPAVVVRRREYPLFNRNDRPDHLARQRGAISPSMDKPDSRRMDEESAGRQAGPRSVEGRAAAKTNGSSN